MNQSQWNVRLAYITLLVFVLCMFLRVYGPQPMSDKAFTKIHNERLEAAKIASALKQCAAKTEGLTNIDAGFIQDALIGTNSYILSRTNAQDEILDLWKTPYQIGILAQKNFIVHSAGPNKIFGDADDIIFNSVSNDFMKP
jgi:hypothetical protein